MSHIIKGLLVLASVVVLSACSSQTQFVKPDAGKIQLGKSTREDVIKTVVPGKAIEQKHIDYNGEKLDMLSYAYYENPSFWGMIIEHHNLNYALFNGVVVSEEFDSAYDKDSTKFDLKKIPQLKIGMSELDVVNLMGQPSGRVLYPLVKDKESRGIVYSYTYARFAGMFTSNNAFLLLITLDKNGTVSNILYKKDGKEQTLASAGNYVEAPVPEKK